MAKQYTPIEVKDKIIPFFYYRSSYFLYELRGMTAPKLITGRDNLIDLIPKINELGINASQLTRKSDSFPKKEEKTKYKLLSKRKFNNFKKSLQSIVNQSEQP